jgi:hypothetical protein
VRWGGRGGAAMAVTLAARAKSPGWRHLPRAPTLPAKHCYVLAGEGSSRQADGLVPDGGGPMNAVVQEKHASRETNHGPLARLRPGWAFGWPHSSNQSPP